MIYMPYSWQSLNIYYPQKKSLSAIIKMSTTVSKWNFNFDERIHVNIMRP